MGEKEPFDLSTADELDAEAAQFWISHQLPEAASRRRQALEIREAILGPQRLLRSIESLDVTKSSEDWVLADCNEVLAEHDAETERYSDAEQHCRRAIMIDGGRSRPIPSSQASTLVGLAGVYRRTNRSLEAEPLEAKAAQILKQERKE